MDKVLTEALRRTCLGNQRAVSALGKIEEQLHGGTQFEDLGVLKSTLELCLATVRAEIARQVVEGRATRATLETVIAHRPSESVSVEYRSDSPTGLPGRLEGRAYLEKARASDAAIDAVVLSLDRVRALESRFGATARAAYLLIASQAIAQKLGGRDELFQWGDHTFVAIVPCSGSGHLDLCGPYRPCTIQVETSTVLIPISISSVCLRISEALDTDALMERIDSFLLKAAA